MKFLKIFKLIFEAFNKTFNVSSSEPNQQSVDPASTNTESKKGKSMKFGDRVLSKGVTGPDVIELQMRLSGFRGTIWDGKFGPGTELQVTVFQKDFMKMEVPTGIIDLATLNALEQFSEQYPIDFTKLQCQCGQCGGFGQGRFKSEYESGKPSIEEFHRYEYPGIHKSTLHAFRALNFYSKGTNLSLPYISCGYRCWINNEQKQRYTTNHMGKAIDCDFDLKAGEDKKDDNIRCDSIRGMLVEKGNFQLAWYASNRKALEPSSLAPTWIHMDVRSFSSEYLQDKYFVKTAEELDSMIIRE